MTLPRIANSPWILGRCWKCDGWRRITCVGPLHDAVLGTADIYLCEECCQKWQARLWAELHTQRVTAQ